METESILAEEVERAVKMPESCDHFNYSCGSGTPTRQSLAVCMYGGCNSGLCAIKTCAINGNGGSIPVATYYGYENWK